MVSLQVLVKVEKRKLQIMAEKAINGDEKALEYLQLEEIDVVGSTTGAITVHPSRSEDFDSGTSSEGEPVPKPKKKLQ